MNIPYFIAPELIKGSFSTKSDAWSVGVIMYLMVTGKYPFEGINQTEVFKKISTGNYDTTLLDKIKISNEMKDLIKQLIVVDDVGRLDIKDVMEHDWIKLYKYKNNSVIDDNIIDSLKTFHNKSLFQKEVMFFLAKVSNDEEVEKLKKIFMELDEDNTGTLEYDEIMTGLNKIGIKLNEVSIFILIFTARNQRDLGRT